MWLMNADNAVIYAVRAALVHLHLLIIQGLYDKKILVLVSTQWYALIGI